MKKPIAFMLLGPLMLVTAALVGCVDPGPAAKAAYDSAAQKCEQVYPLTKGTMVARAKCLDEPWEQFARAVDIARSSAQAYETNRHAAARQVDDGEISVAEYHRWLNLAYENLIEAENNERARRQAAMAAILASDPDPPQFTVPRPIFNPLPQVMMPPLPAPPPAPPASTPVYTRPQPPAFCLGVVRVGFDTGMRCPP